LHIVNIFQYGDMATTPDNIVTKLFREVNEKITEYKYSYIRLLLRRN